MDKTRRTLLAGLAATVAVPGTASALRIEEMDVPRQRLILGACETRSAHERVLADIIRQIEGQGTPPETAQAQARTMNCPFCGCGLAAFATLPDANAPPKF